MEEGSFSTDPRARCESARSLDYELGPLLIYRKAIPLNFQHYMQIKVIETIQFEMRAATIWPIFVCNAGVPGLPDGTR